MNVCNFSEAVDMFTLRRRQEGSYYRCEILTDIVTELRGNIVWDHTTFRNIPLHEKVYSIAIVDGTYFCAKSDEYWRGKNILLKALALV